MRCTRRALLSGIAAIAITVGATAPSEAFLASGYSLQINTITTFTVQNFANATSPGYIRVGMPFKKGDVPSTATPLITLSGVTISAQFDQRRTWSDGSLAFAVCHLRDSTFSANESRTYTLSSATGSYNNTGTKALSDITGAHDFKVTFASTTQYNGTTTVTRGSGAFTASFNTHAAVSTRVTKIHSGAVCESWVVWGMATDDSGGAADPHLKTDWYVSIWKDSNGNIADFEYTAIVEQDWWDVANKFRLNYDATLKDGGSSIQAYNTVQHPYHAHWATVRTTADDNQGRRFWVTAIPTLIYKPTKTYWVSTNYVPPLDTTFSPSSNTTIGYTANYVPCGVENHRASVDAGGDYPGRGLISNMDCVSFLRQTSTDYKCSRVNAFAGLHIPYHYRSAQNRTRPTESADVANTTIALKFRPYSAGTYDWTAVGMPVSIDAYRGASEDFPTTWVAVLGGTGPWTTSGDSTHAVNYSYFMYLLEGEWHFMQATVELATNCCHQLNGNIFAGCPHFCYRDTPTFQVPLSIPATVYSGIGQMCGGTEVRKNGWGLNLFGSAHAVIPDSDVQSAWIKFLATAQTQYLVDNIQYWPTDEQALGSWLNVVAAHGMTSPWMEHFVTQGAFAHWRLTEDANALTFLQTITGKLPVAVWGQGLPYRSALYRCEFLANPSPSVYNPPLLTPSTWLAHSNITIASDTVTILAPSCRPVDGQQFYFSAITDSIAGGNIPAGFSAGTIYYMVNSNFAANTFQVALTLGGAPQTITDPGQAAMIANFTSQSTSPCTSATYLPNADDYSGIARCALIAAYLGGVTGATLSLVNTAQTWMAPSDTGAPDKNTWLTWRWVVP